MASDLRRRIGDIARERFGFEEPRPGQGEAIESAVSRRDTLAVMSTGQGKSAIHQIAGELVDGPTVVVSPLIALQRDEIESLAEHERASEGAQLSSAVGARERRESLADLEAPFEVGSRVAHARWGGGVVHGYDDGRVTVLFDAVGYKSLGLDLIAERGLVEPERR